MASKVYKAIPANHWSLIWGYWLAYNAKYRAWMFYDAEQRPLS